MNQKGFTLPGLLVGAVVASSILAALSGSLLNSQRLERGITSNTERTVMENTLNMILQTSIACSKSGLKGLVLPMIPTSGTSPYSVSKLYYPAASSTPPVFMEAGVVGGTRRVENISITDMQPLGSLNPGTTLYFSTLAVSTSTTGKAMAFRTAPIVTHLNIVLEDSTNKIVDCYQLASTGGQSRAVTGTYQGKCNFLGHLFCNKTNKTYVPGRIKSLRIESVAIHGKILPEYWSAFKTDTMEGWYSVPTVIGITLPLGEMLSPYLAGVRFGEDSNGHFFETRTILNVDFSIGHFGVFDGEYNYVAHVE